MKVFLALLRFIRPTVVITALGGLAAFADSSISSPPDSGSPEMAAKAAHLTVAESMHDFGRVPQGEPLQYEFEITNSGDATLQITAVRPSCGCTTTGDWPHALEPGQSGKIPVKVDTAHFSGPIIKTIAISSNDPTHPETELQLRAKVWTPVSVLNPILIFPAVVDPTASATRSTTIRSEVDTPLTLTDLHSNNPIFKAELKEVTPGKEYELTVTTVPPLPDGTQTARITMKSSNDRMPEIQVQAVVTVLAAVQVAPSEFSIGAEKLAAPEKRYAVVLNNRGVDLQVTDLSTNAPGVTLSSSVAPDHRQFTITVNFPAGFEFQPGEKYFLRGRTNQKILPTFEIPIVHAGTR